MSLAAGTPGDAGDSRATDGEVVATKGDAVGDFDRPRLQVCALHERGHERG
jgi:hypothetical protein